MGIGIFSTYKKAENRVTASLLGVLGSLSLKRMERLLGALMEQSEFQLIHFKNQPSENEEGVPDARITSSSRILIETKVVIKAVREDQLRRHLSNLEKAHEEVKCLLVLTPDSARPPVIDGLGSSMVAWASFSSLDAAIDELVIDQTEVISEREAFLLRELQYMLTELKLVSSSADVVVVPARRAWPEYKEVHAYICQPRRTFRNVQRIAFYSQGQIESLVPEVIAVHEEVLMERDRHEGSLGVLVKHLLDRGWREQGQSYKVFLLTGPSDPKTKQLASPVINDLPAAFTQNQRYVSLVQLLKARHTSELEKV